jgi:hypothetical protein
MSILCIWAGLTLLVLGLYCLLTVQQVERAKLGCALCTLGQLCLISFAFPQVPVLKLVPVMAAFAVVGWFQSQFVILPNNSSEDDSLGDPEFPEGSTESHRRIIARMFLREVELTQGKGN